MRSKTKDEALRIIHTSALAYKENLEHKNVLFLTVNNSVATHFEAAFLPRNFLHLTGAQTKLSSVDFYNSAVNNDDFWLILQTFRGVTNQHATAPHPSSANAGLFVALIVQWAKPPSRIGFLRTL